MFKKKSKKCSKNVQKNIIFFQKIKKNRKFSKKIYQKNQKVKKKISKCAKSINI